MADDRLMEYSKVLEQIEVPAELKAKTIAKMKTQKPVKRYNPVPYAAAAVLAVAVLGGAYLQSGKTDSDEITLAQSLEADTVVEEVALSEGSLHFDKVQEQLENLGLQLGVMEGESVPMDEDTYFDYLGMNPLPEDILKGMTKQESGEQKLIKDADGNYSMDCFTINYMDGEDRSLDVVLSKLEIPDEKDSEDLTESKIGETSVKISYYENEEVPIFTAYFMENGIGFKIKGKGVTQEEFITVILKIVQNNL